jgi:hypothetical protein
MLLTTIEGTDVSFILASQDAYIRNQSFHFARFGKMVNFHRILDDSATICN